MVFVLDALLQLNNNFPILLAELFVISLLNDYFWRHFNLWSILQCSFSQFLAIFQILRHISCFFQLSIALLFDILNLLLPCPPFFLKL